MHADEILPIVDVGYGSNSHVWEGEMIDEYTYDAILSALSLERFRRLRV